MAESSETWQKMFDSEIGLFDVHEGDRFIACGLFEKDADAIIRDHAQARLASRYAEALREIRDMDTEKILAGGSGREVAREALIPEQPDTTEK